MTNSYWFRRAVLHLDYIQGLLDGTLGVQDIAVQSMTVAEALEVERRNVVYCLGEIA